MKTLPAGLKIKTDSFHLCLTNIQDTVVKTWEEPLLRHFTRHGLSHSETVIQILGKLIEGHKGFKLNEEERFVLTAAAYLHDTGMQLPVYAGLKKKSNFSSKEKKTIRDKHHEASYKAIKESVKKDAALYIDWKEECERFAEPVAIVSKYHRQLNIDDDELKNSSIGGETIRLRLLAALLRLADELDQDYKRINSDELKRVDIPPDSKFYWWSHKFVNSVDIQKGKIELYLRFPEGEKDQRILDAFEKKLTEKMKGQLDEVYDILDFNGLRLYKPIKIAEKKSANIDELKIPDDLRSYVLESIVSTKEKAQELSRRQGVTFYLDGVPYSDDRKVAESIEKIISLMAEYHYKEAVQEIRNFQKRELVTGPKDKMIFLLNAGNCLYLTGNLDEAKQCYKEVIDITNRKEMQDRYGDEMLQAKAAALGNIGLVYRDKGNLDEAMKQHMEALDIHREIGNRYGEAADLCNIGLVYLTKGDLDKALKHYKEALTIDKEIESRHGEATQLGNIGIVYGQIGNLNDALDKFNDALDIHRSIGNRQGEANQLGNIGIVYSQIGDLNEALKHHKEALEIDKETGNRKGEASDLANIGLVYFHKGDFDEALRHQKEALDIHRAIGNRQGEATDLGNIGLIYYTNGELDKALKHLMEALDINRAIGNRQGEASDLGNIGLVYFDKGDLDEALKHYTEALAIDIEIANGMGEATHLGNIGLVYYRKGNLDKALKYLENAFEIFEKIGAKIQYKTFLNILIDICKEKGDTNKAEKYKKILAQLNKKKKASQ